MASLLIAFCCLLFVNALGQIIDCNLRNGQGCRENGPFRFVNVTRRDTIWNSLCSQQYKLTIDPLNRFGADGFQCFLQMDVPEHDRFIYSFAENQFTSFQTSTTPFIYGLGLKARISSKAVAPSNSNFLDWELDRAHTEINDNHYSWIVYKVQNNRLSVFSSQGHTLHTGSTALFNPTFRSTYVGLNRLFSTTADQGSGVCRVRCNLMFSSRRFQPGQPGAPGQPGSPGGRQTPRGAPGQPGASGQPGAPGAPGQPGFDGQPGQPGQPGAPGNDGQSGQPRASGPPTSSSSFIHRVREPAIERFEF